MFADECEIETSFCAPAEHAVANLGLLAYREVLCPAGYGHFECTGTVLRTTHFFQIRVDSSPAAR